MIGDPRKSEWKVVDSSWRFCKNRLTNGEEEIPEGASDSDKPTTSVSSVCFLKSMAVDSDLFIVRSIIELFNHTSTDLLRHAVW
ncbi:hypothetical protein DMN91_006407 [Ooceraea biroi]|uniref:Uncharacterized protein n=1 Tax=Ooceraea biroi TaxID=2015173 RepID=A0A3L8DQE5_OOCBI|nr:hypothetical protein DMN91_006407 [Ooceraea biroi]